MYNEEIVDLLDIENKGRKVVKIHEDVNSNIYTTGVVMRNVTSEKDVSDDIYLLFDRSVVRKHVIKRIPFAHSQIYSI